MTTRNDDLGALTDQDEDVDSDSVACQNCAGLGEVRWDDAKWVECPACFGEGWVYL